MDNLILGLGNDICGDDAVGIAVAKRLKGAVSGCADVVISSESGLALMDYMLGYSKAIIIDAIQTPANKPGTVTELKFDDLRSVLNPSPHYTGLPEIQKISEELQLDFPKEIRIFAIEVSDMGTICEEMSQPVLEAVEEAAKKIESILGEWGKVQYSGSLTGADACPERGIMKYEQDDSAQMPGPKPLVSGRGN